MGEGGGGGSCERGGGGVNFGQKIQICINEKKNNGGGGRGTGRG